MVRRAKLDSTPTTSPPPSAAVSTRAAKMAAPHSGGPQFTATAAKMAALHMGSRRPGGWTQQRLSVRAAFCFSYGFRGLNPSAECGIISAC